MRLEDKLNRLWRPIRNKLPEGSYDWLFPSGSASGLLYGLLKYTKLVVPLDLFHQSLKFKKNYNLAKVMAPILLPITTNYFTA